MCDETYALAQPEWEDAPLPAGVEPLAPWSDALSVDGWARPAWVLAPRRVPSRPKGWYRTAYVLSRARAEPVLRKLHADLSRAYEPLRDVLQTELSRADVNAAFRAAWMHELLLGPLTEFFGQYDLVQAYATHTVLPVVATPGRSFIAYEHGTLRELPFEGSWRGRLLALSYLLAAKVIITNVDVHAAALRLGLDNFVFVPHPVDETKYTPGRSSFGDSLRARGARTVLFAPSRQDWREKGNDIVLRAFARVGTQIEEPVLVFGAWGADLGRSRALARELGVERRIEWLKPVPKLELIDVYRGADIVLDQFVFGTFGGIAPEAMACAKPVVMRFDDPVHEWAFPVRPPILHATDEHELATRLSELAQAAQERGRLGAESRAWVEEHHGWRLVAERQRNVYEEVLGSPVGEASA